jgi:hypothetical protein
MSNAFNDLSGRVDGNAARHLLAKDFSFSAYPAADQTAGRSLLYTVHI